MTIPAITQRIEEDFSVFLDTLELRGVTDTVIRPRMLVGEPYLKVMVRVAEWRVDERDSGLKVFGAHVPVCDGSTTISRVSGNFPAEVRSFVTHVEPYSVLIERIDMPSSSDLTDTVDANFFSSEHGFSVISGLVSADAPIAIHARKAGPASPDVLPITLYVQKVALTVHEVRSAWVTIGDLLAAGVVPVVTDDWDTSINDLRVDALPQVQTWLRERFLEMGVRKVAKGSEFMGGIQAPWEWVMGGPQGQHPSPAGQGWTIVDVGRRVPTVP